MGADCNSRPPPGHHHPLHQAGPSRSPRVAPPAGVGLRSSFCTLACALGSVVEHRLHTAGVPGSNPGARTTQAKVFSGHMGDGLFRAHR